MQRSFLAELSSQLLPAAPGYYGEMVWIVVMLEEWLRARAPDWRLGPSHAVAEPNPGSSGKVQE
jgi:asparagine synthase (glutamine-hydrolysing)